MCVHVCIYTGGGDINSRHWFQTRTGKLSSGVFTVYQHRNCCCLLLTDCPALLWAESHCNISVPASYEINPCMQNTYMLASFSLPRSSGRCDDSKNSVGNLRWEGLGN